jgi:riboflavin synthase
MFTGIITDVGTLLAVAPQGSTGDRRLRIGTAFDMDAVAIGASIACSGCCLTVTAKGRDGARSWFDADVSGETIAKTTLGDWQVGRRINLERSLKFGDELGGHLVYGHVDGVGRVVAREPEGGSLRLRIETPPDLARFVASKGSIAVDGISLTVNEVEGRVFGVNIIPHTQAETTIGAGAVGDRVNLEADMLARYVARLLQREGE